MTQSTVAPRFWLATIFVALFASACSDSLLTPAYEEPPAMASTIIGNLEIVSPDNGATATGVVTAQARLTDRPSTSYAMYWRVDAGARTRMTHSNGYHSSNIDVSNWKWNGAGPYTLEFIAEQKISGRYRIVGRGSIKIYVGAPTSPPPTPPVPTAGNPFANAVFYVDPYSNAKKTADAWRPTRPGDAAELDKIATQPQADWFGSWNTDIFAAVNARTTTITNAGALPVFVAYNIPFRDCGGFSSGGAATPADYRTWITDFANAIGTRRAVVVLEPDALAALGCLTAADQVVRMDLIKYAVQTLKAKGGISVYIDAGHSRWQTTATMISRLQSAGIDYADGFSLNVSNYIASTELRTYGEAISAGVAGKHFIIDTSRNGQGSNGDWCNATGRGLGAKATANTGAPLVDAFFWIKRPGESDGACNGGPSAGRWWAESTDLTQAHALGLAMRATTVVAFN